MTSEHNKAIVHRFYEAFAANDEGALKEVLAPDSWPIHTARPARRTARCIC